MDIDRFIARNRPAWDHLDVLIRRGGRKARNLSSAELDEMVRLYLQASSHLSHARTAYHDPALTGRLTRLVSRANGAIYGARPRARGAIGDFFVWRFPAAVYQSGRFVAASAALLLVPALVMGVWLANSDAALDATGSDAVREAYLNEDFEDYYSSQPAADFASQVTVNNIQVSLLAFASGILLCVPTAALLVFNGASVGVAGGLFAAAGELPKFFGLILPHGMLELTAVIVAGAAGLRLGWSIVAPGDRSRSEALGQEARQSVVVAIGLALAFVVAGLIEGFVTGRGVPTSLRLAIGFGAWAALVCWVVVQGRAATARGVTGRLGELDRGWDELAAARERAWAR